MPGDAPYEGHNPVLVILLILIGIIATPWLAIRAVVLLVRAGIKRTTHALLKGAAALAWAGAIGIYTWGVLHLFFLDESGQAEACREALGPGRSMLLDGYEPSFIPLRFGCHIEGGQTYEAAIPGYVNPATGVFTVTAAALTGFAVRSRNQHEETNT
ncbi:hypothetical protein [Streptomyces jumonjinensis]|uniref:Uncharacterized protein n=1 Tax=Streptomyces jumonjinensis TaxID=1945 RepID=A0A646KDF3_STRJU|nr:hypothetical protein [Streptomyces jumonjinensis]MQT00121.1 hypothetical protein [Streptomyces jumonjinensis]